MASKPSAYSLRSWEKNSNGDCLCGDGDLPVQPSEASAACLRREGSAAAMTSTAVPEAARPRALQTILLGGSIAGLLDGLDAVVLWADICSPACSALSKHRRRATGSSNVSRRLAHHCLGCRTAFVDCLRSGCVLLRGQSYHSRAIPQTVDLRTRIRNRSVPLHALHRCSDVRCSQENRANHAA